LQAAIRSELKLWKNTFHEERIGSDKKSAEAWVSPGGSFQGGQKLKGIPLKERTREDVVKGAPRGGKLRKGALSTREKERSKGPV